MPQRAVRRAKPRQHVWRSSQDLLLSHSAPTASIDRLHAGLHAMSHLSQAISHASQHVDPKDSVLLTTQGGALTCDQ